MSGNFVAPCGAGGSGSGVKRVTAIVEGWIRDPV